MTDSDKTTQEILCQIRGRLTFIAIALAPMAIFVILALIFFGLSALMLPMGMLIR